MEMLKTINRIGHINSTPVIISTAFPGTKIPVKEMMRNPDDYHGDPNVDHFVSFGPAFECLVGKYDGKKFGPWEQDKLVDKGIVVLEHHFDEARQLMTGINSAAERVIVNEKLYDDKPFCSDFFEMVKEGYRMMNRHAAHFGIDCRGTPVSFIRAGLVTTRAARGIDPDAAIDDEVLVVTKRMHRRDQPPSHLAVTVTYSDIDRLRQSVDGQMIEIADTVFATGSSAIAFILTAHTYAVTPRAVIHKSITQTAQGVLSLREFYGQRGGIQPVFYSVGDCDELNDMYYLTGKPIADAGHLLRHFMPNWYKQPNFPLTRN